MSDTAKDIAKSIEADLALLTKPIKEARAVFYYGGMSAIDRVTIRDLTGPDAHSWLRLTETDDPKFSDAEIKKWNDSGKGAPIVSRNDVYIATTDAIRDGDRIVGFAFFCEGGQ